MRYGSRVTAASAAARIGTPRIGAGTRRCPTRMPSTYSVAEIDGRAAGDQHAASTPTRSQVRIASQRSRVPGDDPQEDAHQHVAGEHLDQHAAPARRVVQHVRAAQPAVQHRRVVPGADADVEREQRVQPGPVAVEGERQHDEQVQRHVHGRARCTPIRTGVRVSCRAKKPGASTFTRLKPIRPLE